MLWPAVVNALPLLIPSARLSCGVSGPAFHSQLAYVAPILQSFALYISSLDGFEKIVDPAALDFAFGLVLGLVLVAMPFSVIERIHECGKELAARVLKYEHGHDGRYLFS